ncbi:hypothetical protein PG995_006474 [Apiospora arundinis]
MRLSIPVLLAPIVGVLGLEVSPGDIVKFEFQVGTLKAIGSLEFEPDYCPHTQSSPQQTTTTTESSLDAPATNANTGGAQRITRTVIQTVFVTITDSTPNPTTVLHSGSVRTASANWTGYRVLALPSGEGHKAKMANDLAFPATDCCD